MCEKRTRKIRKGSHVTRLRENRRLQRLQRLVSNEVPVVAVAEEQPTPLTPQPVDKNAQCRLILELTLKTISLMQKNSLIQQKIVALQKETSEFVAAVMSNPENRRRYHEHVRVYGQPTQLQLLPIKIEP